jgi:hypothetical protein
LNRSPILPKKIQEERKGGEKKRKKEYTHGPSEKEGHIRSLFARVHDLDEKIQSNYENDTKQLPLLEAHSS